MLRGAHLTATLSKLKEPRAANLTLGTIRGDLRHITYRYTNLLFVFVVVGFVVNYTNQEPLLTFSMNLLAVFPSSVLLDTGLRSIRNRYGGPIHAILYMTFGNAVNLVTSIVLLRKRQIQLLQTSLIGGILSNVHLMLGLGLLVAGTRRKETEYNSNISHTYGSLLTLAVTGLVLPTASQLLATPVSGGIMSQSHAISVIFIVIYAGLLYFELYTHTETLVTFYDDELDAALRSDASLSAPTALALITLSTTLLGFNTYLATNSLEGVLTQTNLTKSFVGIVLLPLFTNDLEPIMAGYQNDLDLCLQATVGKCIQTTLFVIPVTVIIGWGMGVAEMTLSFNGFDVAALLASAIYITFLTNNGKGNWLEGAALLAMFGIIAVSAYYIE